MSQQRPTVTLCMIVKDEEHIIHECLESIYPYIDRYDISDTGSTDKTKEIIKKFFDEKGIPGEIYDDPWMGFGKSRTTALRHTEGKADYAWMIDADDRVLGDFVYPPEFGNHWAYALRITRGDFEWWRNQIFKTDVGWEYVGVLHEYASCPEMHERGGTLAKISANYSVDARTMGARTKQFEDVVSDEPEEPGKEQWRKKYLADAEVLLDCLTNPENPNYEPDNLRYMFYLAQSYFDGGNWESAVEWYTKRAEAGGWEEEQWYSIMRVAMCKMNLGAAWHEVQDIFLQAWNMRPTRVEPLYYLARTHRTNNNPRLGYFFAKMGCTIPFPQNDVLFVSRDFYEWMIFDELASTAWYANDFQAGLQASNKLLSEKKFPPDQEERIVNNWRQYVAHFERIEEQKKQYDEQMKAKQIADSEARKDHAKKVKQNKEINKRRKKKARN
jgi:glycosyltransferase involved in cell wall biosynthesis